jgi:hypothetical protein
MNFGMCYQFSRCDNMKIHPQTLEKGTYQLLASGPSAIEVKEINSDKVSLVVITPALEEAIGHLRFDIGRNRFHFASKGGKFYFGLGDPNPFWKSIKKIE